MAICWSLICKMLVIKRLSILADFCSKYSMLYIWQIVDHDQHFIWHFVDMIYYFWPIVDLCILLISYCHLVDLDKLLILVIIWQTVNHGILLIQIGHNVDLANCWSWSTFFRTICWSDLHFLANCWSWRLKG